MRTIWPDPNAAPDAPELIVNRQALVAEFNDIVGVPGADAQAWQSAFVAGQVSYEEAAAYVRYARYMIASWEVGSNQAA